MRSRRPAFQLVTTGHARPSDELLAEVAARTGIPELAGHHPSAWRRLVTWLLGDAPR